MKSYDYDEHDEDEDVLRDGETLHVPLMMRDGLTPLQRAVRDAVLARQCDSLLVTDGAGGVAGLHRPGPRLPVMDAAMRAARDAVEQAYQEAELADANAWRGNAAGPERAEAGTLDQITADRLSLLDERERAYLEVEERDRNAWRSPR